MTSGNYKITVRDVNGCTKITSAVVEGVQNIQFNVRSKSQCSSTLGSMVVSFGLSRVYRTFLYKVNDTSKNLIRHYESYTAEVEFKDLLPGEYIVEVFDLDCGFGTKKFTVVSSVENTISDIKVNKKCILLNRANGEIDVDEVIGGTQPFLYAWDNGSTSNKIEAPVSGFTMLLLPMYIIAHFQNHLKSTSQIKI
ncbi:MAG: SprB repeat-containing protein [Saprospiraceae bacterium]|nr:SprB repeat-containing protein [Saprospiraceae bacterium]